jgi:hypothetical protein
LQSVIVSDRSYAILAVPTALAALHDSAPAFQRDDWQPEDVDVAARPLRMKDNRLTTTRATAYSTNCSVVILYKRSCAEKEDHLLKRIQESGLRIQ